MFPRFLGPALLVGGIILLCFGFQASDSVSSSFSRFFTGNPTDKAVWLIVGGAAAAVLGCVLSFGPMGRKGS